MKLPTTHKHNGATHLLEKLTEASFSKIFLLWATLNLVAAFVYFTLASVSPENAPTQLENLPTIPRFLNSLYFSIITGTSTGYGDIAPYGFSRFVACLQLIGALLLFGVFISKLSTRRQELALEQVHRLTFDDVYHNTREGLYIVRKDCDRIIHQASVHGALREEHWQDIAVAFQQCQSLIDEIPDFIGTSNGQIGTQITNLDAPRSKLLHEALRRTLHRIESMLDVLENRSMVWHDRAEIVGALGALLKTATAVIEIWSENVKDITAFGDISLTLGELRASLNRTLDGKHTASVPSIG